MYPEKPAMNMDKRNKRCSKFPSTASNVFAASVTRELPRPFAGYACKREICPQLLGSPVPNPDVDEPPSSHKPVPGGQSKK